MIKAAGYTGEIGLPEWSIGEIPATNVPMRLRKGRIGSWRQACFVSIRGHVVGGVLSDGPWDNRYKVLIRFVDTVSRKGMLS